MLAITTTGKAGGKKRLRQTAMSKANDNERKKLKTESGKGTTGLAAAGQVVRQTEYRVCPETPPVI